MPHGQLGTLSDGRFDLAYLLAACVHMARRGGRVIRDVHTAGKLGIQDKRGGNGGAAPMAAKDVLTVADTMAQGLMVSSLRSIFPGIRIVGEEDEAAGLPEGFEAPAKILPDEIPPLPVSLNVPPSLAESLTVEDTCLWIDPLDGTIEFVRGHLENVVVLIGISVQNRPVAGVMLQPFLGGDEGLVTYGAVGVGVFGDQSPATDDEPNQLVVATTVSSAAKSPRISEAFGRWEDATTKISQGSGQNMLKLLRGEASIFVQAPGASRWDTCAGEALLAAIGGKLTDLDGQPYEYADLGINSYLNEGGVLAARSEALHELAMERMEGGGQARQRTPQQKEAQGRGRGRGKAQKHDAGGKHRVDPEEILAREAVLRNAPALLRPGGMLSTNGGVPAEVEILESSHIADTWGGMGIVSEVGVRTPAGMQQLIVKHVRWGSASSVGDVRKRDSYHSEANFYENGHADALNEAGASVPKFGFVERAKDGLGSELMLCISKMEGMPARRMSPAQTDAALRWLATLHAKYWGVARADRAVQHGLQPQGAYWYLDTRLQEWNQMPRDGWQGRLKLAARALDERLKADPYQTVVHGDAKTENMLFTREGGGGGWGVGFFDFQYTGKAHPAKDLCYALLGLEDEGDARTEAAHLQRYLSYLAPLLEKQGDKPPSFEDLHAAYGLATCDFARWMSGWGWNGFESTMRRKCSKVLEEIDGGRNLGSEEAYMEAVFKVFPVPAAPPPPPQPEDDMGEGDGAAKP